MHWPNELLQNFQQVNCFQIWVMVQATQFFNNIVSFIYLPNPKFPGQSTFAGPPHTLHQVLTHGSSSTCYILPARLLAADSLKLVSTAPFSETQKTGLSLVTVSTTPYYLLLLLLDTGQSSLYHLSASLTVMMPLNGRSPRYLTSGMPGEAIQKMLMIEDLLINVHFILIMETMFTV